MSVADSLTDGLWRLDLGAVNAYLVDDGTVTLVDAGTPRAGDDIRQGLDEAGYTPEAVDRVLLTHYDVDHVGAFGSLALDVPVYAMEPDASMLTGERTPPLTNHKGLLQRVTGPFLSAPAGTVERLSDGATVGEFTAIHTPGHTPGHVAYHHPPTATVFVGDLLRGADGGLGMLPWVVAYDNGDVRESIQRLADRGLDFDIACPGHGGPVLSDGATALTELASQERSTGT